MAKKEMPGCDYFISSPNRSYAENREYNRCSDGSGNSYGYDIREVPDLAENFAGEQIMKIAIYNTDHCEEKCAPVFTPILEGQGEYGMCW